MQSLIDAGDFQALVGGAANGEPLLLASSGMPCDCYLTSDSSDLTSSMVLPLMHRAAATLESPTARPTRSTYADSWGA